MRPRWQPSWRWPVHFFGFVVKTEKARDTLLKQINSQKWGLNVYRHTGTFMPCNFCSGLPRSLH